MKKYLFAIVLLISTALLNAQVTVTFRPGSTGKAAHVDNLNTTTNYGNYPLINAGYNTVGGTPTLSRNYVQFNLSSIPTGATITSARLSLYNASGSSSSEATDNTELFALVQGPWLQDSLTWSNQPSFSLTDTVVIGQQPLPNGNMPNINIAGFVQTWVNNPASNYGMVLMLQNEPGAELGNFQIYGSCFNADSTVWPQLEVTYTYSSSCHSQTVLRPDSTGKSAHIDNLNTTTNYGDYPLINAGYNTVGGTPTLSRNYIQFDLSGIPSTATIDTAYLSFYNAAGYNCADASDNSEMFALVQGPWKQDSVTWVYQPAFSLTDTIQIGSQPTANGNKTNINITSFVQNWVSNPGNNFGMVMMLANEQQATIGNFQVYGSTFNADSTVRPQLVIDWTNCAAGIPNLSKGTFDIYPNPVSDVLNISAPDNYAVNLIVYDLSGRQVMTAGQVKSISTKSLASGVYLLQISTANQSITKKVVVAR